MTSTWNNVKKMLGVGIPASLALLAMGGTALAQVETCPRCNPTLVRLAHPGPQLLPRLHAPQPGRGLHQQVRRLLPDGRLRHPDRRGGAGHRRLRAPASATTMSGPARAKPISNIRPGWSPRVRLPPSAWPRCRVISIPPLLAPGDWQRPGRRLRLTVSRPWTRQCGASSTRPGRRSTWRMCQPMCAPPSVL